ncbi:MAG: hypothetical protein K2M17_03920 [Bacilli bacterium]|nr:hypothetical protein [Bacilli bacterium]
MNKMMKLLVVFFVVAVVGAGIGLGVYGLSKNGSDTEVDKASGSNNEDLPHESDEQVLELGKKLFEKTLVRNLWKDDYLMYASNKVTFASLDDEDALRIAFGLSSTHMETNSDNCELEEASCYKHRVLKSDFDDVYYDIFGKKVEEYRTFAADFNLDCSFDDRYVVCNLGFAPAVAQSAFHSLVQFQNAYKEDNQIVVLVDYLAFNQSSRNVYSAPNEKGVIETLSAADFYEMIYQQSDADLFTRYKGKTGTFEVRFALNTDGTYYWYSSEFIK